MEAQNNKPGIRKRIDLVRANSKLKQMKGGNE